VSSQKDCSKSPLISKELLVKRQEDISLVFCNGEVELVYKKSRNYYKENSNMAIGEE
jgi:hypothetical protein